MKSKGQSIIYIVFAIINIQIMMSACSPQMSPQPKNLGPSLKNLEPEIKYGGRAVALCRHPSNNDELIVASESGGLFKTIDRGINWKQVSGISTLWFTDVKYFTTNPSVVIATAKKDTKVKSGGGIWRSSDGGNSWKQITLNSSPCGQLSELNANCISVEPGSNRIWVGTSCGLLYSDDQGISWTWLMKPIHHWYSSYIEPVSCILTPARNHIKILAEDGVSTSDDGQTFTWRGNPTLGAGLTLVGTSVKEVHNELACSPVNENTLFFACKYADYYASYCGLFISTDNGATWKNLVQENANGRLPFVKVAKSQSGKSNQIDIYYSNGAKVFARTTLTDGDSLVLPLYWESMTIPHPDVSDLEFETDESTPLLLTSDGGINRTETKGRSWFQSGAGKGGFNALQVTSLAGQLQENNTISDLYFATQDNNIYASNDEGLSWPYVLEPGEGYNLDMPLKRGIGNQRMLTGVLCFGCFNFISRNLLNDDHIFYGPLNSWGDPCLLKPGYYMQCSHSNDYMQTSVNVTDDTGATWMSKGSFDEGPLDWPRSSLSEDNPVIYLPVTKPGTQNIWNSQKIGIKRITNVLSNTTPIFSDITGFGSLGSFRTGTLAQSKPFGFDRNHPEHLIVPDVQDNNVKVTFDGGQTWKIDSKLTDLVTENGAMKFSWGGGNSQIISIEFDPANYGRIFVGTMQSGVFTTCDNGLNWSFVPGSKQIPEVTDFYFNKDNTVVISSYGRSLWSLAPVECTPYISIPSIKFSQALIYWKNAIIPISQIPYSEICTSCGFFVVNKGFVSNYKLNDENNSLIEVTLNEQSEMIGLGADGTKLKPHFNLSYANIPYKGNDEKLNAILRESKFKIKGFYLEDNNIKGLILSDTEITYQNLPKEKIMLPKIYVDWKSFSNDSLGINKIKVFGKGYFPDAPLSFILDSIKLKLDANAEFSKNGSFNQLISTAILPGEHLMCVEQNANGKLIKQFYSFEIPRTEDRE